jgi:hypothetical protein
VAISANSQSGASRSPQNRKRISKQGVKQRRVSNCLLSLVEMQNAHLINVLEQR